MPAIRFAASLELVPARTALCRFPVPSQSHGDRDGVLDLTLSIAQPVLPGTPLSPTEFTHQGLRVKSQPIFGRNTS